MNLRIPRERLWFLLRIAAPCVAAIALFFSGLLPVEKYLAIPAGSLTASVAPSDVASLTNEERIQDGLAPLSVSPLLTEAAQLKAEDMAAHSYYAHTGPDGRTMLDWMHAVGYNYLNAGENLVIDRTTASQAVNAWMNSPDHRANILRPQFTQIGIGVAEGEYDGIHTIFVVQEFGTPYPTSATLASSVKTPRKPMVETTPAATTSKPVVVPVVPALPPIPSVPKPKAIPSIASLKTPKAEAAATSTASTTPVATSTPATSTISYTLAPEFFAPVTLTSKENRQVAAESAAPQASSATRLAVWMRQIKLYVGHFLGI